MEVLVLIFAVVALLCGAYAMFRYRHALQSELADETLPAPKTVIVVDEEPLDQKYAKAKDMWLCRYCETLNPNAMADGVGTPGDGKSCIACGKQQ